MVWSDPEIKRLSREFVTVADEVYMLYPEDPGNLNRVKDRPEHVFFKKYGEAMPPGAWNHPGTKQGIYMIGPDAEYLEGRFAAAAEPADIRARLQRALQRWTDLKAAKGYRNDPVPAVKSTLPPGIEGELILRVNLRDLPRGAGDQSGARYGEVTGQRGAFLDYIKWAWNENWIGLPRQNDFVPNGSEMEEVNSAAIHRIAREVLVDNVRGQAPVWQPGEVRSARLTMQRLSQAGPLWTIEYRGRVELSSGSRSFTPVIYGRGIWDSAKGSFQSLDLVATGPRTGASRFNRRESDPGPAPMGVALSLYRP